MGLKYDKEGVDASTEYLLLIFVFNRFRLKDSSDDSGAGDVSGFDDSFVEGWVEDFWVSCQNWYK